MERNLLYNEIGSVLSDSWASIGFQQTGGKIHYVDLAAGEFQFANSAICIPENFRVRENAVDVILYFHGLIIPVCSGDSKAYGKLGMKSYLENNKYFERLCPKLSASKKNVIFIAVAWMMKFKNGEYQYEGRSGHRNNVGGAVFNGLMESCLTAINRLTTFGIPASRIDIGNIILAGHSAGGAPMQQIIKGVDGKIDQRYLSKIKECWGFDSQYSSSTDDWVKWLSKNPERVYKHFSVGRPSKNGSNVGEFRKTYPKATVPPRMHISNLWSSLKNKKAIDQSSYSFIEGNASHCGMVDKWFTHCLESSGNIKAIET
jgi:hypothetical protein